MEPSTGGTQFGASGVMLQAHTPLDRSSEGLAAREFRDLLSAQSGCRLISEPDGRTLRCIMTSRQQGAKSVQCLLPGACCLAEAEHPSFRANSPDLAAEPPARPSESGCPVAPATGQVRLLCCQSKRTARNRTFAASAMSHNRRWLVQVKAPVAELGVAAVSRRCSAPGR